MTVAFGRHLRSPAVPAARRTEPMEEAWPRQSVWTGQRTYCIVS